MKLSDQVIFYSIVFTVYGLINFYIGHRALSILPNAAKPFFIIIYLFVVISFFAGRIVENYYASSISTSLIWIGSFWFAFMFYFFLSILTIDLLRAVNYFLNILPDFLSSPSMLTKTIISIIVSSVIFLTIIAGHINIYNPKIQSIQLNIDKKTSPLSKLNIILISDIHLGHIFGRRYLEKITAMANKLKPDIILLAGDIIDEDIKPVIRNNVGEAVRQMKALYGVYAVTGNHEYIGGVNDAFKYLTEHEIVMLRDSALFIENSFYIVGREDRSITQFAGKERKSLEAIMKEVNTDYPVILMDHQPFGLSDAMKNKVDLQLSGHTHNGQLWPLNYIINLIYEVGWGYKQINDTHYYVSCGAGGWGPPVRTVGRPEIVQIKINFKPTSELTK